MHKLECGSGRFKVFHIGKLAFTVEDETGKVLRRFTNLSEAFTFVRWWNAHGQHL